MYVCVCVFFLIFFLSNEKNAISFKEREKERKKKKKEREWQSGGPVEKKVRKKRV